MFAQFPARTIAFAVLLMQPRRVVGRSLVLYRTGKIWAHNAHWRGRNISDEAGRPSGLSHHQGRHDRWSGVHHPLDLGQAGRHPPPRHRSEVASGLDWRPAADHGSRRPRFAVPEEILGLPERRPEEIVAIPRRKKARAE